MTARPLIRQGELLKSVADWVRMGFAVVVTADEVKVMPKDNDKPKDAFENVKLGK